MTSPRVSVLMPAWNAAKYFDEAIESILAQDFRDFELVIVDDASTDGSAELLAAWATRDPRIVFIRNVTNMGAAATSNVGLQVAQGEYIARMDADDISLPGRLSAEVVALDADPTLSMVSMNFQLINANGDVLRTENRVLPPEIVDFFLNFGNPIGGHSQVMFRRDLAMRGGGYDPTLKAGEDYELWTRLARLGRILILPQLGMRYRMHPEQLTARVRRIHDDKRWIVSSGELLKRYLGRELSENEIASATGAWRKSAAAIDARAALAVMREATLIFARQHGGDRLMMRTLRRAFAERLAGTAMVQFHARHLGAASRYVTSALASDVVQAIRTLSHLFRRAFRNRLRRARRMRLNMSGIG